MLKKIFTPLRFTAFIIVVLTSIPLFIRYMLNEQPKHQFMIHLHIWAGAAFIVFALSSMIIEKSDKKI